MDKNQIGKEPAKEHGLVLLISNESDAAAVWAFTLKQAGYEVCLAGFSDKTLQVWPAEGPDLVLMEDYKIEARVFEFCRRLRAEAAVPVLLLTSHNDENYLLEAYRVGVDECIPQPVSPRLFLAKVKAWLNRSMAAPSIALEELRAGGFALDPKNRQVSTPCGAVHKLTNLETRLLHLLMNHPDWVLETDYLIERVWNNFGNGDNVLLKNLIYRLRRKLEPNPSEPRYLLTEANLGYKFTTNGNHSQPNGEPSGGTTSLALSGPGNSHPAEGASTETWTPSGSARPAGFRHTGQLHPPGKLKL